MAARTVPTPPTWTAGQRVTAAQLQLQTTWSNFWSSPPMFRMEQTIAQSVANITTTQITMDASRWDTDSGRAAGTPWSYTIPVGMSGRWTFSWAVEWDASAVGSRIAILFKNGTAVQGDTADIAADNDLPTAMGTATVSVVAGDVMDVRGYQNTGGALNTKANAQFASYFEGRLVSLASP